MHSFFHPDHKGVLPSARVKHVEKEIDYFSLDVEAVFAKCKSPHQALCVMHNARMKGAIGVELDILYLAQDKWGSEFTCMLKHLENKDELTDPAA